MDTIAAYFRGQAARAAGNKLRVFDWDKAAEIIVSSGTSDASAGLAEDWDYTGGDIFNDGRITPPESTSVYLASLWATPQIVIDGRFVDCWKYADETPGWDAETYWPESARKILGV